MRKLEKLIIPVINRETFEEASSDIRLVEKFLPTGGWIHIDVSDGRFSNTKSWGSPQDLKSLETELNIEAHLMVQDLDEAIDSWIDAGVKRVIIPAQKVLNIDNISEKIHKRGAELMISYDPNTQIEGAGGYLDKIDGYQVLSVSPGPSGQDFEEESLSRISFLRGFGEGVKIEVDGGINLETGRMALEAGANILASSSYIFKSQNPEDAYKKLDSIL